MFFLEGFWKIAKNSRLIDILTPRQSKGGSHVFSWSYRHSNFPQSALVLKVEFFACRKTLLYRHFPPISLLLLHFRKIQFSRPHALFPGHSLPVYLTLSLSFLPQIVHFPLKKRGKGRLSNWDNLLLNSVFLQSTSECLLKRKCLKFDNLTKCRQCAKDLDFW